MKKCQNILWKPSRQILEESNVARLMRRCGAKSAEELWRWSVEDIGRFWKTCLQDLNVEWFRPYTKVFDGSKGFAWTEWFIGGKLNIVANCLDRQVLLRGSEIALRWEGDDGATRQFTFSELTSAVNQCANALLSLGVQSGDAVGIYLPMISEVAITFFACLKIGAVAVPVFSGFGPEALAVRLNDAEAKVLVTADGGFRRDKKIPIKPNADRAVALAPRVKNVLVVRHTEESVAWNEERDHGWNETVLSQSTKCPTAPLDSEHPAMILYTSGTTGKPKGCVHTHAGALAQIAKELAYAFDVKPGDRFFWLTDIGWMMGPWELIGVLFHGASVFVYEGAPDTPDPSRVWQMVERHQLTHLGISPTAIRLLKKSSLEFVQKYPMKSLRILGSTGEAWDPESYQWFFEQVGKKRCPIINISGGTELVGCLLSPLPIMELKSCTLCGPGLGMDVDCFNEAGHPVRGEIGYLVCKQPFPSMTRGFLKDHQRYLDTYFSKWPDVWYHGDWATVDEDGFWFLRGRADDTIKVASKRIGPAEVESALNGHPAVAESAAIGVPHPIKGEVLVCFVVLKQFPLPPLQVSDTLRGDLIDCVVAVLGKSFKPEKIEFVPALPKTRSAKIVRGLIRKKYLGEPLGDLSSVENPDSLTAITFAKNHKS